jgi:uncharacterized protein YndB with AHSA1/START domain
MNDGHSLEVVLEVRIEAPPQRVWRALVAETAKWWPAGFFARPEAKAMVFEARLGGRQYEDWGDGQGLLWAEVVGIKENELLLTAGELFPEYGGPARLLTTYTLKADGEGTILRLRDCAFGAVGEKLAKSLEAGWKTLIADSLKPYVEGRKA